MKNDIQTIEKTSKWIKAFIAVSSCIIFTGILTYHGEMIAYGFIMYIICKIIAWWNNG